MLLPRSAIYVSLVMVTVILALVAWLILDTMSQRPNVAPRFQHTIGRASGRVGSQSVLAVRAPSSSSPSLLSSDERTLASQPGLSPVSARWNE